MADKVTITGVKSESADKKVYFDSANKKLYYKDISTTVTVSGTYSTDMKLATYGDAFYNQGRPGLAFVDAKYTIEDGHLWVAYFNKDYSAKPITVNIDESTWQLSGASVDGDYGDLEAQIRYYGKSGGAEYRVNTIKDTSGPEKITVTSDPQAGNWTNDTVTLTVSATDSGAGVDTIYVRKQGDANWTVYNNTYTVSSNGTYEFYATDRVGNASNTTSFTVSNIDKIGPTISEDYTLNGDTMVVEGGSTWFQAGDTTISLTVTVTDEQSGVDASSVTYDNKTGVAGANNTYTFIGLDSGEGVVSDYVDASDNVGNKATKVFVGYSVDGTAPLLDIISDTFNSTNGNAVVTATFTDEGVGTIKKTEYSLDGETWTEFTGGSFEVAKNGTIYLRAADGVGNTCEAVEYEVTHAAVAVISEEGQADVYIERDQLVAKAAALTADQTLTLLAYEFTKDLKVLTGKIAFDEGATYVGVLRIANADTLMGTLPAADGAVVLIDAEMDAAKIAEFKTAAGIGEAVTVRALVPGAGTPTETAEDLTIGASQTQLDNLAPTVVGYTINFTGDNAELRSTVDATNTIVVNNNEENSKTAVISGEINAPEIQITNGSKDDLNDDGTLKEGKTLRAMVGVDKNHAAKISSTGGVQLNNYGHMEIDLAAAGYVTIVNSSMDTLTGNISGGNIQFLPNSSDGRIADATITATESVEFFSGIKQTIEDSTITAGTTFTNSATLDVDNSTLKGESFVNKGTMNLTDATVQAIGTSVFLNSGTLNVSGVTLEMPKTNLANNGVMNVQAGETDLKVKDFLDNNGYKGKGTGVLNLEKGATLKINKKISNVQGGTINLKGGALANDVKIDNKLGATVNWDLTVGVGNESSIIWTNLTNSANLAITVDAAAKVGNTYTLADTATSAAGQTFTLTGYGYNTTITVGSTNIDYAGFNYKLAVDAGTSNLVLTAVSEMLTKAIAEYQGGQKGQHTNNDNFTYYTNEDTIAAVAFQNPGEAKGAVSYKWAVTDDWKGYENAWTEIKWEDATTLTDAGVSLTGASAAYKFVYLAGYDKDGTAVSMNIYQALSDTTAPDSITEIKGTISGTWVNAKTENVKVTGHGTGGEGDVETTASGTVKENSGYYYVTINAVDKPTGEASGIAVTELNGDVQKFEISTDGGKNWTKYDQNNPLKLSDGEYDNYKIKVTDKAGNETIADMSTIKVDATDATIGGILVNGNLGSNGWWTAATISGEANDALSGVSKVEYRVNSGSWQTATGTESWSVTAADSATTAGDTYEFRVTDVAGNVSTASYKLSETLKVDTTDATLTVSLDPTSASGDNGWYKTTPTYTVAATDALSGVWKIDYRIDDGTWTSLYLDETPGAAETSVTKTLSVVDTGTGGKIYTFRVTDVAGNVTESVQTEIKVDTKAPDMTANSYKATLTNAAQWDWTEDETKSVTEITKDGEWFTNRRDGGAGTLNLSGNITAAQDGGSPITPTITITYEYQTWDNINNKWVGSKKTETKTYSSTDPNWTYDETTGDWSYDLVFDTVKNAAGTFKVEVSAKDEAGNVSATSGTFTGNFDNTIPSNPIVTLNEQYSKTGLALDLTAKDGQVGGTASTGIEQSDIHTRYWATSKGALNLDTIFTDSDKTGSRDLSEEAEKKITITNANIETYWTDVTNGEQMAEDAYNIAFYDQNDVGTYSTGKDDIETMSHARYIVDRSAPILGTVDAPTGASAKDASGNDWFDEAGVTVTFKAVDAWKGTDTSAGYEDHVSGINKFYVKNGETWEETTEVTKTITTAGENTYTFKADDKAGNESSAIDSTYRIDTAAPTYDSVALTGFVGEDKLLGGAKTVYINAADLEGVTGDVTAKVSNVRDTYDTAKDGGVGIDRTGEHTFYLVDDAHQNEFFTEGNNDFTVYDLKTLADGTHKITLHYEDKLVAAGTATPANHTTEKSYYFTKDTTATTWALEAGYTYTVDGGAKATSPKGPITKDADITLVQSEYVLDWSKEYYLTFNLSDTLSGISYYDEYTDGEFIQKVEGFATVTIESGEPGADQDGTLEKKYVIYDKAGNESTLKVTAKRDTTIDGSVKVSVANDKLAIWNEADKKYYVNTGDYNLDYTEADDGKSLANFVYVREDGAGDYTQTALGDTVFAKYGASLAQSKAEGETVHNAIITDAAGNQKNLDATVVVDTTKAAITLKNDVTAKMFTAPTGAPTDANASADNTTEMTAGKDLTVGGGYSSSWFSALSSDFVITISDLNLSSVVIDGTEMYQSGTSVEYTINKSSLNEGANTRVITATDKAGNVTTSTITLNYDSEAPEFSETFITVDDVDRSSKGGTTKAGAEAKAIYVNDISKFTVSLSSTDTSTVTSYYSFSEDFTGSWSAWETIPATLTTGEGYYRFAEVDAAGNSTMTENYYFITSDKSDPANPYVTFTVDDTLLVNFSTKDGDNQMTYQGAWYDKDVKVDITFSNQTDGSNETHYYVASDNFDKAAWDAKYADVYKKAIDAGKSVADASAAARRAAIEVIDWDGHVETDKTNTKASAQLVATKTTSYYFISVDEAENTSRLQEVTVNIDKLGTGGVVTLDGKVLSSDKITWSKEDGLVTVTLGESGASVKKLEYTTDGSAWTEINLATKSFTLSEGQYDGLKIRATDKFGNVTDADYKAGVDQTDPTATITGYTSETWTNEDVALTIAYADNLSGVATKGLESDTVTAAAGEVKMVTKTYTVTDNAGNIGVSSTNVYIDKAAPSVSVTAITADGGYASNTWTKNFVTAFVTATDLGSGLATDPSGTYTYGTAGEVFNETITYKATDLVGNEGNTSITVKIDKQAPTISDVTASATTWTKDNVKVTATLADGAGSGIAGSETFEQTITSESATKAGTKVTIEALDNVGNRTTQDVTVYIDKTAPTVDVDLGDGKWSSEVTVKATFDDALSGVKTKQYSKDGGEWTDYEEAGVTFTSTGNIKFKAIDNVGNEFVSKVYDVTNIDENGPTVKANMNGYTGGWTNENVLVTAMAYDDETGIDYAKTGTGLNSQLVTEEGENTVTFTAYDKAGNTGSASITVKIDKSADEITTDTNGYTAGTWTNKDVKVTATAEEDGLSGLNAEKSDLTDKTFSKDGVHKAVFRTVDNAGNVATEAVTVKIDKTAAMIVTDRDGKFGWNTEAVTVKASARDDLSGFSDEAGKQGVLEKKDFASWTASEEGVNEHTFEITDSAGNKAERKVTVLVDTKAAEITTNTHGYTAGEWTNQDVTVSATATDAGAEGVLTSGVDYTNAMTDLADKKFGMLDGTFEAKFNAVDVAGNKSVEKIVTVKIDKTAPTVDVDMGDGKWSKAGVDVTATFADALSGVKTKQYSKDGGELTAYTGAVHFDTNGTIQFFAEDEAGNVLVSQTYKVGNIDTDKPTLDVTLWGTEGEWKTIDGVETFVGEWTNQDVDVRATAKDATSGIDYEESKLANDVQYTVEGKDRTFDYKAVDNAGNETKKTVIVSIDKTAAEITTSYDGQKGWNKEAVTVTAKATDNLSGFGATEAKTIDLESQTTKQEGLNTLTFEATDNAGNKTEKTVNVLVDTKAPELAVNTYGYESGKWTNKDVMLKATAADATSGVDYENSKLADSMTLTVDQNVNVKFYATDVAGNKSAEETVNVKIDKTAATIETSYDGQMGWNTSAVTVTAKATDNLSGFGATEAKTLDLGSQTTNKEGLNELVFEATDNAGNKTTKTVNVLVDTVAPKLTVDTYGYKSGTWTNEDVQIVASATDAGAEDVLTSGVDYEKSALTNAHKSTKEGDRTFTFYAYDVAGNKSAEETVNVKIDKTAAKITTDYDGTKPGTWNKAAVTVAASATDNLSGFGEAGEQGVLTKDLGTQKADKEGVNVLTFTATDTAGNVAEKKVTVLVDTVAPTMELTAKVANKDVNDKWTNKDVAIVATAKDATSGLVDWSDKDYTMTEETRSTGKVVEYTAKDAAGNDVTKTVTVKIDKTAAEIETSYDGIKPGTWNKAAVKVTASATDNLSGFGEAGEQGELTKELKSQTADKEGVNVLTFTATDTAGNVAEKKVTVLVDTVAPTMELTAKVANKDVNDKWTNKDVAIVATAKDATSGLVDWSDKDYTMTEETRSTGKVVEYTAKDAAGNDVTKTVTVKIDKTAAEITTSYDDTKPSTWNTQAVKVTASATDNLSGFGEAGEQGELTKELKSWTASEQGLNVHTFEVTDTAGNKAEKTVYVLVDTVAPELTVTTYGVTGEWTNKDVQIYATATDATSGVDYEKSVLTNSTKASMEQDSVYTYVAYDKAGNKSAEKTVVVKIDKTAAEIATSVDTVAAGTWFNKNTVADVTATATDNLSGFDAKGTLEKSLETWQKTSFVEGVNEHTFTAQDVAGNESEKTVTILVDTVGATFDVVRDSAMLTTGGVVLSVVNAYDATSGIDKIYWKAADAASWQEYAFEIDETDAKSPVLLNTGVTVTKDGTYEFKVVDRAGNETVRSIEVENIVDPEEKTALVVEDGETKVLKPGDVFNYDSVTVEEGGTLVADKNQYDKMMMEHTLRSEGEVIVNPAGANVLTQYSVDQLVGQGSVVSVQFNEAMIDIGKMTVSTEKFGEKGLVLGFENGYGTQDADSITFAADANVAFGQAGYVVDLWTGANKVTVEKNATVDFRANLDNAATISVNAGATVKSSLGTFQDFTVAKFANISFSNDANADYYESVYVPSSASVTTGKYTTVTVGDITGFQPDDKFRTYTLTVGANAEFTAGVIDGLKTVSVTAGAKHSYEAVDGSFLKGEQGTTEFTAGNVRMTAKADTLKFGNFTETTLGAIETLDGNDTLSIGSDATFKATSVDLGADTDKLTVGARSTVTIGDVFGTQAVTTGAESDVTFGAVKHLDTLSIGADAEFAAAKIAFGTGTSDKMTVGARSEAKIGVGVDLEDAGEITGLKSLTLSSGKDCAETLLEAGDVTMLSDKAGTVSLGSYTETTLGAVRFGALNDTLSIGADSTFAAKSLDFGAGTSDKMTVGARSEATVEGTITGVQTLAVTAGKAATKTAEAVYTKLEAGKVTMEGSKADALTIGNYADVTLGGVTASEFADKLTVGNYDTVTLGDVDFGDGNDTFKVGDHSTVRAGALDFGEGEKDTLTIGKDSKLGVTTLDNLDKLTIGNASELWIADTESYNAALETDWGKKYSSQIHNGTLA